MNKSHYPIWQFEPQMDSHSQLHLSANLRSWLQYPGSFMERLKMHGVRDARIHVLQQAWQIPLVNERALLHLDFRVRALLREVIIVSDQTIWMYARTVFPRVFLTGKELQFARLKNRSLGSVLFKNPTLQRSEFEMACLKPGMAWYETVTKQTKVQAENFWARRSVFAVNGKELLLTEVFMPAIETLC